MAFRVDNIIVSDKNVMLLSDGKQYVADIEKEYEILNSFNSNRDKNPWNLKTEDGKIINNLFSIDDFTIRTQVITGSNGISKNYCQSHETFLMPNSNDLTGLCQFYDNAYSISNDTKKRFTSTFNTTSGTNTEKYEADDSFIRYDRLSSYDNMVDYYITPNTAFSKKTGTQYLTEYPINQFYSDFGDNESTESPTIYGDSCPLKYYLDDNYSVSAEYVNDNIENIKHLRTYYGIGNTGNSIYLIYRNDKSGITSIESNGGHYVDTRKVDYGSYAIAAELSSLGYMSNITTLFNSTSGIMYASDPYSDFFPYTSMQDVSGFYSLKQPNNHTFILLLNKVDGNKTSFTYIPRNGLDKTKFVKTINENISDSSIIELEESVLIATNNNGVIIVSNPEYSKQTGITTLDFTPFKYASIGHPDSKVEDREILDGNSNYNNFSVSYNGSDIVCLLATTNNYKVSLLSTKTESTSSNIQYDIGNLFMIAAKPSYELLKTEINEYSPWSEVISSVPTSSIDEESGKTVWTYVLSSVQTREITGSSEIETFELSTNSIRSNFTPIFDYSPVTIDDEIENGNYVFLQFDNYGLSKCFSNDIFYNQKFVKTTTTGPSNKNDSLLSNSICKDVHFNFITHNDTAYDNTLEKIKFIGSSSNNRVFGKPSLNVTYNSGNNYYNTFSVLPFVDNREKVIEPTFYTGEQSRIVEQAPISSFRFIQNEYIPMSCGVSVKNYNVPNINHDVSLSLVRWNTENGKYSTNKNYSLPNTNLEGLHLQYNGICTEVYVNGKNTTGNITSENRYTSTIYEYPHRCFGELKTAGTGLSIFDGELSASMKTDDIFILNNYLIIKNYCVKNNLTNKNSQSLSETVKKSGKTYSHDTGSFNSGGYVVSNFFLSEQSSIPSLYDSTLVSSSKTETKTTRMSETIYDYNYLWHILPKSPIEFYPASKKDSEWSPFYALKYVDFIKYHNGYYYIALSSKEEKSNLTIGYDIIETTDLFKEGKCIKLSQGEYVSGIKFFGDNVAVEYTKITDAQHSAKRVMWFKQGQSSLKTNPIAYCNTTDFESESTSSVNRASISINDARTINDSKTTYDNVEVIHSLNRFSSVVNHKSNLFSIKISDLGLDTSSYLNETQKNNLKTWFKNRITTIVDSVKPAHTQLFDVYID